MILSGDAISAIPISGLDTDVVVPNSIRVSGSGIEVLNAEPSPTLRVAASGVEVLEGGDVDRALFVAASGIEVLRDSRLVGTIVQVAASGVEVLRAAGSGSRPYYTMYT